MNLTTAVVESLALKDGQTDQWFFDADDGVKTGLAVRLRRGKKGVTKTWYVIYQFAGKRWRVPLGDVGADYRLVDARDRAYQMRRDAKDGKDPQAKKAAAVAEAVKASNLPTYAEYVETYLARRLKELRPKTYRDRERMLAGGEYFATFKSLRLDQIDKAAVAKRINFLEVTGVTKPSASVAQAARMALLDVFKMAVQDGHLEVNPVLGTRQPAAPRKQKKRKRVLSGDEIAALWNASDGAGDYERITRLTILLGGRRQEIGGMRWSELNGSTWTLPADRAKTKHDLVLPLPPQALEIIGAKPQNGRDLIFGGRSPDGFTLWSDAKRKLDERLPLDKWVFHDLRRTLVTGMHNLGIAPHIVKAVVNHAQESDVHNAHYNHALYLRQKAEALKTWADHVAALAAGKVKTADVVPLAA